MADDIQVTVIGVSPIRVTPNLVENGGAVVVEGGGQAARIAVSTQAPVSGGVTDHGALTGLDDDDHPQYLLASSTDYVHTGSTDYVATSDSDWLDLTGGGATTLHSHAGGGVDAADITYTPADNSKWTGSADPGDVDNALDQLAGRVAVVEAGGAERLHIDASSGTGTTYGALTGDINGVNTTYTVSEAEYASGTLAVYLNGQLQTQGSDADYVETSPASGTFDFNTPLIKGDVILVVYGGTVAAAVGGASKNLLSRNIDVSGGTFSNSKTEYQAVAASATQTLLNYSGGDPGLVAQIALAVQCSAADANAIRYSHLQIYYDGSLTADVDIHLANFFAAEYVGDAAIPSFGSEFFGFNSGNDQKSAAYYLYLPVPFSTGIKIDFVNGSGSNAVTLWANIIYYTGVTNDWPRTRKLLCASGTLTNQTKDAVITLVDQSSLEQGRLAGVYMSIDSYPNSANPATAPMEGNVKIYVDGGVSAIYESSGFEDFFNCGFYFLGAPSNGYAAAGVQWPSSPFSGLTFKSTNTWNAYRFFIVDPILFMNALKITWNCGDSAQVNFTGGVRVMWTVWYYTE